jgi:tRNA (guanine-N7-)-methyltransferase
LAGLPSRTKDQELTPSRPPVDVSNHLIDPSSDSGLARIEWAALFGNQRPVELEVGSGKGLFLINAATSTPDHNFLGIELSKKYARFAAERLARRELPNVKIWRGDARFVIERLVPACSLRAVHVYFPDPWWKKRHKKRRVFTAGLLAAIERTLEPQGMVKVASDVEEYFGVIQGLIQANPRFRCLPIDEPAGREDPPGYLTHFDRKYRLEGRPVFRADYLLEMPG